MSPTTRSSNVGPSQATTLTPYQIGAGIQMTPNVSRLLIKWGVSDIIGDDLVQCTHINMRSKDGTITQRTELVPKTVTEFGFPVSLPLAIFQTYLSLTTFKSGGLSTATIFTAA